MLCLALSGQQSLAQFQRPTLPKTRTQTEATAIMERVAGIDDFEVAEATTRAAVARWPAARITLRQALYPHFFAQKGRDKDREKPKDPQKLRQVLLRFSATGSCAYPLPPARGRSGGRRRLSSHCRTRWSGCCFGCRVRLTALCRCESHNSLISQQSHDREQRLG